MTIRFFQLDATHPSWKPCLKEALQKVDGHYLEKLSHSSDWLPGPEKIFHAFTLPVNKVNYILFGESPYPRAASANGYAFWDAAVDDIWSDSGLSKRVNRATSLRHIIKMLLLAEGLLLPQHTSQADIASIDKHGLVKTNEELFNNFLRHGFLLLNATPVLYLDPKKDAAAWLPFTQHIVTFLLHHHPEVKLVLFGKIANIINQLFPHQKETLYSEHPYNLSFIHNQKVLEFFKPLHLIRKQ